MAKISVKELLLPLIQQARDEGKWLHCRYQDLWFSPNELAAKNDQDRFLWGPINWTLRDPLDRVRELERAVECAKTNLAAYRTRMEKWDASLSKKFMKNTKSSILTW